MATHRLLAPALLLAASILPAQTPGFVIPDGKNLASAPGNSNHLVPFNPTTVQLQCLYSKSVMGTKGVVINGVRFRPDEMPSTYFPYASQLVRNFNLYLGNHPGAAHMDRYSHKGNYPKDRTQVVAALDFNLPGVPGPTSPQPQAFMVDLPLSRPFLYTNVEGFYLEIVRNYYENVYRRWYIDCEEDKASGAQNPAGSQLDFGTGCPRDFLVSTGKVMQGDGKFLPEAPYPGQTFFTEGASGLGAAPLIGVIGLSDKSWGGIPLPLDLGPLGAPRCNVYCGWNLTRIGLTGPAPEGTFKLVWGKIPYDPAFRGVDLFHQALVVDPAFNALGLTFSQGVKLTLGPGFPAALETGCVYGNCWGSFQAYDPVNDDLPQFWKPRAAVVELY